MRSSITRARLHPWKICTLKVGKLEKLVNEVRGDQSVPGGNHYRQKRRNERTCITKTRLLRDIGPWGRASSKCTAPWNLNTSSWVIERNRVRRLSHPHRLEVADGLLRTVMSRSCWTDRWEERSSRGIIVTFSLCGEWPGVVTFLPCGHADLSL